jgi:hypothetical protein
MNSKHSSIDHEHLDKCRDQLVLTLLDLKNYKNEIEDELFDRKIDEMNKSLINLFVDLKMTCKVNQELNRTLKEENLNLKLQNKKLEDEISQFKIEM